MAGDGARSGNYDLARLRLSLSRLRLAVLTPLAEAIVAGSIRHHITRCRGYHGR